MDIRTFLEKSKSEISRIVKKKGPRVCVLPVNGTRRWFLLEKGLALDEGNAGSLIKATGDELRRLVNILFDYGVHTVIAPVYGRALVEERGAGYLQMAIRGLKLLNEADFQTFYDDEEIRVRFYGNYRQYFENEPSLLEQFCQTERSTARYTDHRLFYGVCGDSAVSIVTQRAVELGRALSHEEAVKAFYGEPVSPADLFIGFDAPTAFDMPLLDKGGVDLYFTLSPSPYLDRTTVRKILYDWIFVRNGRGAAYPSLASEALEHMREYYRMSHRSVIGYGKRRDGIWYYELS